MYRIVIEYTGSPWLLRGTKEELAMLCEKRGDCRVVSIEEVPEQEVRQMSFYQTSVQGKGGRYGNQ